MTFYRTSTLWQHFILFMHFFYIFLILLGSSNPITLKNISLVLLELSHYAEYIFHSHPRYNQHYSTSRQRTQVFAFHRLTDVVWDNRALQDKFCFVYFWSVCVTWPATSSPSKVDFLIVVNVWAPITSEIYLPLKSRKLKTNGDFRLVNIKPDGVFVSSGLTPRPATCWIIILSNFRRNLG